MIRYRVERGEARHPKGLANFGRLGFAPFLLSSTSNPTKSPNYLQLAESLPCLPVCTTIRYNFAYGQYGKDFNLGGCSLSEVLLISANGQKTCYKQVRQLLVKEYVCKLAGKSACQRKWHYLARVVHSPLPPNTNKANGYLLLPKGDLLFDVR